MSHSYSHFLVVKPCFRQNWRKAVRSYTLLRAMLTPLLCLSRHAPRLALVLAHLESHLARDDTVRRDIHTAHRNYCGVKTGTQKSPFFGYQPMYKIKHLSRSADFIIPKMLQSRGQGSTLLIFFCSVSSWSVNWSV